MYAYILLAVLYFLSSNFHKSSKISLLFVCLLGVSHDTGFANYKKLMPPYTKLLCLSSYTID